MELTKVIQIKESISNKIQTEYNQLKKRIMNFIKNIGEMITEYPGIVVLTTMLIIFPFNDLLTISISGFLIYMAILTKQYIKSRIEKETLDSIDLDRFGNSSDNKKSIMDIINDYVENCFDRDVLFFNIINKDDYIDQETERRLLNELLDSTLINMSSKMRLKLSRYIPEEELTKIIGRRCMMVITIFVATHNQNIYKRTNDNKRIEL